MKTENFLKYCSIILNKPYKNCDIFEKELTSLDELLKYFDGIENVDGIVNGEYIIFACPTLPPVRIKKCLIEVLRDEKWTQNRIYSKTRQ